MRNEVRAAVSRFLALEAHEVRLVARCGGQYVMLTRRQQAATVRLELGSADAGPQLPVDDGLRARLGELGFSRRPVDPGRRVWAAVHADAAGGVDGLVTQLQRVFEVLSAAGPVHCELTAEAHAPPDNPRLVEAMRAVARSQAVPERQALYAALVNATLLVPVDPETLDRPPTEQAPLVIDDLQGRPVLAVFSDAPSLRSWSHTGHPWASVHGVDFFAHAERAGVGAVRINPAGAVGGELYSNEIEVITEGVRRFQASRMN